MHYTLYDYVNLAGDNDFKAWTLTLQPKDRVKLAQKLDMLETVGSDLPPQLLSDTRSSHIKKLRLYGVGQVQLRPRLCKGPINNNTEFTLLLGATEKGMKPIPNHADAIAESRRQEVIGNPIDRRCIHE